VKTDGVRFAGDATAKADDIDLHSEGCLRDGFIVHWTLVSVRALTMVSIRGSAERAMR
jgi:hypothetical protein